MDIRTVVSLHSFFRTSPDKAIGFLTRLDLTLEDILMNQAQMKAVIEAADARVEAAMAQLDKITAELTSLQISLANTNNTLSPDVEASIIKLAATTEALKAKTQAVDDLSADAIVDATVVDPIAVVEESVKAEEEAEKEAKEEVVVEEVAPVDMVSTEGNSPS